MCGYILATNWQNFTEKILSLSENIVKSFRGGYFFWLTLYSILWKSRRLSSVVLLSSSSVCVLCFGLYYDSDWSGKYDCNTWLLFANMLPNNDSSASSNSSVRAGVSLLQHPSRWHRRNASSRSQKQKPDHAGEQYNSLAGIADLKTSLIDAAGIPWLRTTRSTSSCLEHDVSKLLTWSAAVSRSFITTPRAVRLENTFKYVWQQIKYSDNQHEIVRALKYHSARTRSMVKRVSGWVNGDSGCGHGCSLDFRCGGRGCTRRRGVIKNVGSREGVKSYPQKIFSSLVSKWFILAHAQCT